MADHKQFFDSVAIITKIQERNEIFYWSYVTKLTDHANSITQTLIPCSVLVNRKYIQSGNYNLIEKDCIIHA